MPSQDVFAKLKHLRVKNSYEKALKYIGFVPAFEWPAKMVACHETARARREFPVIVKNTV